MLRDHYAPLAAAALAATLRASARDASEGARKASKARALGLPYGQQLENSSKR